VKGWIVAGGGGGWCFKRCQKHPPACGKNIDAYDDADRTFGPYGTTQILEQRRTCEIDEPVHDNRKSFR
jgi:hypothetical protein